MKRIQTLLILLAISVSAFAQKEQDFATKFMEINGEEYGEMTCSTVSPQMMKRIMELDTLETDNEIRNVLSHLKSIQIVEAKGENIGDSLFCRATELAQQNQNRYKLYANDEERLIYLRKRNNIIVEMVFIAKIDEFFNIVNLTGNMDESFLQELTNM